MNSPIRWPGGKRRLADTIVSHFPRHRLYAEACCGSAACFWAKDPQASASEVLNDADGELINFYWVLHKRGRRLAAHVDAMPYSRTWFARTRASRPRSCFGKAARFWYLNRVAFGAKRRGESFGVQASRRPAVLSPSVLDDLDACIERLRGVLFESLDAVRLIELYDRPDTLLYVDPPYYELSQDYACTFGPDDHRRLAASLAAVRGTWLLSYNDHPTVRALYPGCPAIRLDHRYTMGRNSRRTQASDQAAELLLSNRPLARRT